MTCHAAYLRRSAVDLRGRMQENKGNAQEVDVFGRI